MPIPGVKPLPSGRLRLGVGSGENHPQKHITVKVVEVNHLPVRHAFGFIFETSNARLAISGDTTYCPALIKAAKNVDMLVHEVLIHRELPIIDGVRSAETVTAMQAYRRPMQNCKHLMIVYKTGNLVTNIHQTYIIRIRNL